MKGFKVTVLACLSLAVTSLAADAQPAKPAADTAKPAATTKPEAQTGASLEVFGFAMADAIFEANQSDPNWFDTMRPTKLPASAGQFGEDGRFWFGVRQSRFGVKATLPTGNGDVFAHFEFDMFGVGVDAGQTTIRLRHAYGQWKQIGAGQTNSPFMDGDVFPNTVEYWGPNGMLFFRNVQVFWQPINRDGNRMTIALERPGASGDGGVYADRVEVQNIQGRFPLPDLSAEYRLGGGWGYVELAGILRAIYWDDVLDDAFDLTGNTTGWGLSLSSNLKPGSSNVLRLQAVYGEGIQNYFNDAPVDVGIENNPGNSTRPIEGVALPILGLTAYLDHNWSSQWSSAIGWSMVDIDNSNAQDPSAYSLGQYASFNILHTPVPNVMVGAEFQWLNRENFSDGFDSDDFRVQFSFKYNFSRKFGGN